MTRARELARLGNENVFTAEDYNSPVEVGINSTNPSSTLDVRGDLKVGTEVQLGTAGIVTAVQFSGNITGVAATFSGDVSIGGTLTYEDVTNIDSVGVITARDGLRVTGIATATAFHGDGSQLTGIAPGSPVGGATTNTVFFENDNSVDVNYSVTSGKNAMSAGPIAIKSGITVTVPSGSFWTIV